MDDVVSTLIASPDLSFPELRGRLEKAGWILESQSKNPILPLEPELAVFIHQSAHATIHYTFNPVVMFRVLQFRGQDAHSQQARALPQIPSLSTTQIRSLLGSKAIRDQLLGLFAAQELEEVEVLDAVETLCVHPQERIARTALQVRDSLQSKVITHAAEHLLAEHKLHPDRSALFSNLSGAELRKQVLRWLGHDFTASNPAIDRVLRSALVDTDPEVRITAVLVAARLGASNVAPAIRDADVPTSTRYGADQRDRHFYKRLQQTTLEYLASAIQPGLNKLEHKREQFRKAVSGEIEVQDDPTLLLYALTTPLQPVNGPTALPNAVEQRDGDFYLRRSKLALSWVSPVSHWLGEDSVRSPLPSNPIRQVTPESGFFIAQLPLSSELALWTSEPTTGLPSADADNASPFLCTFEMAKHLCEVLSDLEGVQLVLPSADQWEMAARGPDGRRYPWGNCLGKNVLDRPSPWFVKKTSGHACEWTQDADASGAPITCGGEEMLACARRSLVAGPAKQCAVRPVLKLS